MENKVEISSDGVCIYITSKITAHKIGLFFLIIFNFSFYFLAYLVLSLPEDSSDNVKSKVFFVLIGIPIYIFTLGRYTAWNLWGEERIIINTKTINYQYSYGVIETKMTTKPFRNLSFGINLSDFTAKQEKGQFILNDYDENNLPFEILTSSGLILKSDLEIIKKEIETLFMIELSKNRNFIPYSIN